MRMVAAAVSIALAGTPVFAGVCGEDTGRDLPLMEAAKEAFLKADYPGFVEIAGSYFPDLKDNYNQYFGQLQVVFPNGFTRCVTVLQRREEPGFHQDLVFFYPAGSAAPMALLMVVAEVGGEMAMVEFTYNTGISEVLDEIK